MQHRLGKHLQGHIPLSTRRNQDLQPSVNSKTELGTITYYTTYSSGGSEEKRKIGTFDSDMRVSRSLRLRHVRSLGVYTYGGADPSYRASAV